ncbi:MAG: VWA domain-containing protein [Thermoguttaceae bacterium]|nr:VWA domain-containing protein [Thermoguttaceae bacterium]
MKRFMLFFALVLSVLATLTVAAETGKDQQRELWLLLDVSNSMLLKKHEYYDTELGRRVTLLEGVKRQAETFIKTAPPGSSVRIFPFSDVVFDSFESVDSEDQEALLEKLRALEVRYENPNSPKTRLYAVFAKVLENAETMIRNKQATAIQIIVLTDGWDDEEDSAESRQKITERLGRVRFENRPVFVLLGEQKEKAALETTFGENIIVVEPDPSAMFPIVAALRVFPEAPRVDEPALLFAEITGKYSTAKIQQDDGAIFSGTRAETSFASPGLHRAKLLLTDASGAIHEASVQIEVLPKPPVKAEFSAPETIEIDTPVQLINQSSRHARSEWVIDGKHYMTQHPPLLSFSKPGEYAARLTVYDEKNASDSATRKIVVRAPDAPVADFVVSPETPTVGDAVKCYNRSTGRVATCDWQVDGINVSSDNDLVFTPNEARDYQILLRVVGAGGENEARKTLRVVAIPKPEANFSTPSTARVDELISIEYCSFHADEVVFEIEGKNYEIPDGASSFDVAFPSPGKRKIKQICRNAGGESRIEKEIDVMPWPAPEAAITVARGRAMSPLVFAVSLANADEALLDFGDGETVRLDALTATSVEHTYAKQGNYVATINAKGRGGETSVSTDVAVATAKIPPTASFTAEFLNGQDFGAARLVLKNDSVGEGPFTLTFSDGRAPLPIDFGEVVTIDVKGPTALEIALTACSGEEFAPDRITQTFVVKRDKIWMERHWIASICIALALLASCAALAIVLFHARANALRVDVELREAGETPNVVINNIVSSRFSRTARARFEGGAIKICRLGLVDERPAYWVRLVETGGETREATIYAGERAPLGERWEVRVE